MSSGNRLPMFGTSLFGDRGDDARLLELFDLVHVCEADVNAFASRAFQFGDDLRLIGDEARIVIPFFFAQAFRAGTLASSPSHT